MKQGLVHCYTGDGKGKTTAAMGLGLRAAGCGLRVKAVQFLKSTPTGEVEAAPSLGDRFTIHRFCTVPKLYHAMTPAEQQLTKEEVASSFAYAKEIAVECDLLILDEIFAALSLGLLLEEELAEFIHTKPKRLELVLTGREAPRQIIDLSDYVSEINCIKHPFGCGTDARKGIEF